MGAYLDKVAAIGRLHRSSLKIHNLSVFLERHNLDLLTRMQAGIFQPLAATERHSTKAEMEKRLGICRSDHPYPLDAHDTLYSQAAFGDYAMTYYAMKLRMLHSPLAITECRSQSKLNPLGLVIFRGSECLYLGRVLLVLSCEHSN
jgi:hypothetical protein